MQVTIEYNTETHGEWTGEFTTALAAGVDYLGAVERCDGYAYRADETGRVYLVAEDEVAELGAAILDEACDAYSLWCGRCGDDLATELARQVSVARPDLANEDGLRVIAEGIVASNMTATVADVIAIAEEAVAERAANIAAEAEAE